jgi:hypothetical protein
MMEAEQKDAEMPGGYRRISRATYANSVKHKLQPLRDWMHKEEQSRFDSSKGGAKRKWIAEKEYLLHYARTLTASLAALYQRWLVSEQYAAWQAVNRQRDGTAQTIGEKVFRAACLKVSGLKWESKEGKIGVISHSDIERLNNQWAVEVLGSNL